MISSNDSLAEAIIHPTSQSNQGLGVEPAKKQIAIKQFSSAPEAETPAAAEATNVELVIKSEPVVETPPTATQLLSASIEKVAKEQLSKAPELKEGLSAIEAQAKLTQSISSVLRTNQSDFKMKDINLNTKATGLYFPLLMIDSTFLICFHHLVFLFFSYFMSRTKWYFVWYF